MAFLGARCATSLAPDRWLPKLDQVQTQANGAWAVIDHRNGGKTITSSGELIAVEDGRILLLGEGGIDQVPVAEVEQTKLEIFRESRKAALWATLGTLSTLSHGVGLIFSAPVWIISGIGLTAGESRAGMMNFRGLPPKQINKFARFPQGLPRGLDLKSLKPKPAKDR